METKNRLMSIDALRGFDMFFITGGATLIAALCAAFGCGDCWLATQMKHVPWEGFAHHDTIFPLFLFLAGVSWPFSLGSQVEKGRSAWAIHRKVILRMATLFFIEVSFGGLLKFKPEFRLMGVLSYIGLSWGVAAILFMHVRKLSCRIGLVAALLVGYWAVLRFGLAPDAPEGMNSFMKEANLVSYLDRTVWPTLLYKKGVYEPESFFSLTGGIAHALIGMCVGNLLRNGLASPAKKAGTIALLSVGFFALTMVFVHLLGDPIVKALWTPAFVLAAACYSTAMLALFYWIIDVKGWRRWTLYFRVIGMNSIFIYLCGRFGFLGRLGDFFFGGLANQAGAPWAAVISAAGMLAAGWGLLYVLYRHKTFLRI